MFLFLNYNLFIVGAYRLAHLIFFLIPLQPLHLRVLASHVLPYLYNHLIIEWSELRFDAMDADLN
ncbi:hypothetical protein DQX05_17695 [Paenibacillus thiaminolyticus]|uniref:Uncharacterized protein n=1 Tax=Paenibacillus thiaminolyticus TaxID=49283 RepID=A0A3A3GHF4_PANTH|nr:hypothetical protein DQX05_17695 [Paenibacillus thiaminolyticus]